MNYESLSVLEQDYYLVDVVGGLMLLFDNTSDFYAMMVLVSPVGILQVLETG